MGKKKKRRLSVTFVNDEDVVEHISEQVGATPFPEIKPEPMRGLCGEDYGLYVGDFCLPESTLKQDATWLDKKPSAEELAVASQTAVAVAEAAEKLAVPPGPLSLQLTLQNNTDGNIPPVKIKNEPPFDMEEPTVSTANPQVGEEVSVCQEQDRAPPIIVPQLCTQDSESNLQGNTVTISGSSLPPEVQIVTPTFQENFIPSGLLHPDGQAAKQQSQENVQVIGKRQRSGLENALLKKVLAVHRGLFPTSTPKRIQIRKTEKGIVAVILAPKAVQKPAKKTILVPTKTVKTSIVKSRSSQPKPKHKKRKSKHKTKVVPKKNDEAEEGWEEVNKGDKIIRRKGAQRDADEEKNNEEGDFCRASKTIEECTQSMLYNVGTFDQGFDSEMEGDEQKHKIMDDKEEEMGEDYEEGEDEEDDDEVGIDDPKDSDYNPYRYIRKKKELGKKGRELEVSSVECSVPSFNSDDEKSKQKTKREPANYFLLSCDERRKHILKLQLAKTKQLRLECKLCKDNLDTIKKFQLHFEEKHPGEAEKFVTNLQLTLERKRIAFREQKEKEAKEKKDQLTLKKKKFKEMLERRKKQEKAVLEKKSAQKKKAGKEEKMWLEKMAECESLPRKSTRLGLKKAKTAFELLGLKCGNSENKCYPLETHSSATEPELVPKPAAVPTTDQSNQKDAYDVSMRESKLQTEEDNGSKAPTRMTGEEPEPQRDKQSEDTNTNTDITIQEMNAESSGKEKEDNENPVNATIHLTEPQGDSLNEDTENRAIATILETDAQMNEENEDNRNLLVREKNALRLDGSANSFSSPQRKLHQTDEQETETSNERRPAKTGLVGKNNVSNEHVREHEPVDLKNGCNDEQLVHVEPFKISARTDNKIKNLYKQDLQSDYSEQVNNPVNNEIQKNEHEYEAMDENCTSTIKDATNPDKTVDNHVGELDSEDQASKFVSEFVTVSKAEDNKKQSDARSSADGGSSANLSQPVRNEPTSGDVVLPGDDDAKVVTDSTEQEEAEFIPEVDVDVIFELDAWSNILLECTKCSSFIYFWRYMSHLNEHDKWKKTRECGICGKRYRTEGFLLLHQKDCSGKTKLSTSRVCEVCGKYVNNIKEHHRVHQEHTFTCKICNDTFPCKGSLVRHMQVHSSVKKHVCNICGRSFSQSGNLKGHMRQHTKEKPYKCDMCEKSFVHNVSLKTHRKRDHGIDPWVGANTTAMGRRKKQRDDSSKNMAKKRRSQRKETEDCSTGETAVKRKRGRKTK